MFQRKVEDVDELFVKTKIKTSEIKIVGIEIPDFLDKIEKKVEVKSPRFKLAGVEFYILVIPGFSETKFIYVGLFNCSDEDQTTSVTFTDESGVDKSLKMYPFGANDHDGFVEFLSHEEYKAWAKDHEDVFKVKVRVTLHQKEESAEDGWIRYVCGDLVLIVWFSMV